MSSPAELPELPDWLAARYEPEALLGAGAFGRVFRVRVRETGGLAALKVLDEGMARDPVVVARFRREAVVTQGVRHPGIVRVLEHAASDEGCFIAYEFVDGEDLEELGSRPGGLPETLVLEVAGKVAEALQVAHDAGVVHRDLKPANVLMRGGREPVLCDFGIARAEAAKTMTAEGMIMGTLGFMAPEVLLEAAYTPASDQYAWAASVFLMLYGELPQPEDDPHVLVERARRGDRPRIPGGFAGRNPGVEGALLRALDPAPSRRFPSMRDFAAALRAAPAAAPTPTAALEAPAGRTEVLDADVPGRTAAMPRAAGHPDTARFTAGSRAIPHAAVAEPEASRLRPLLLGGIGLALLGLVVVALRPGGHRGGASPVATTTSPPDRVASPLDEPEVAEALAAVRTRRRGLLDLDPVHPQATDRFLAMGGHIFDQAPFVSDHLEILQARRRGEEFLRRVGGAPVGIEDGEYVAAWGNLAGAVGSWFAALGRWAGRTGGDPFADPRVPEVLRAEIVPVLLHGLEDWKMSNIRLEAKHSTNIKDMDPEAIELTQEIGTFREDTSDFLQRTEDLAGALAAKASWPDERYPPELDALRATFDWLRARESFAHDEPLRRLLAGLARVPDGPRAYLVTRAILLLLSGASLHRDLEYATRVEVLEAVAARLWRGPWEGASEELRRDLLFALFAEEARAARMLPREEAPPRGALVRLVDLRDHAEEHALEHPWKGWWTIQHVRRIEKSGWSAYVSENPHLSRMEKELRKVEVGLQERGWEWVGEVPRLPEPPGDPAGREAELARARARLEDAHPWHYLDLDRAPWFSPRPDEGRNADAEHIEEFGLGEDRDRLGQLPAYLGALESWVDAVTAAAGWESPRARAGIGRYAAGPPAHLLEDVVLEQVYWEARVATMEERLAEAQEKRLGPGALVRRQKDLDEFKKRARAIQLRAAAARDPVRGPLRRVVESLLAAGRPDPVGAACLLEALWRPPEEPRDDLVRRLVAILPEARPGWEQYRVGKALVYSLATARGPRALAFESREAGVAALFRAFGRVEAWPEGQDYHLAILRGRTLAEDLRLIRLAGAADRDALDSSRSSFLRDNVFRNLLHDHPEAASFASDLCEDIAGGPDAAYAVSADRRRRFETTEKHFEDLEDQADLLRDLGRDPRW